MSSILPFFLLQVGFFHTRKKRRRDIVRTTLIELVLGKIQLPEGMLSITMEDVAAITNLSPIGIEVSTLFSYPTQIQHTYDWPNQTAYSKFLKRTRRRGQYTGLPVRFQFGIYWICKCLVCNQSVQIQKSFIPIADHTKKCAL